MRESWKEKVVPKSEEEESEKNGMKRKNESLSFHEFQ